MKYSVVSSLIFSALFSVLAFCVSIISQYDFTFPKFHSVCILVYWVLFSVAFLAWIAFVLAIILTIFIRLTQVKQNPYFTSNYNKLMKNISDRVGWDAELFSMLLSNAGYTESIEASNKINEIDSFSRNIETSNARFGLIQLRRLLVRARVELDIEINSGNQQSLLKLREGLIENIGLLNRDLTRRIITILGINISIIVSTALVAFAFDLIFPWGEEKGPSFLNTVVFPTIVFSVFFMLAKTIEFFLSRATELSHTHFDDLFLALITRILVYCGFLTSVTILVENLKSSGLFNEAINAFALLSEASYSATSIVLLSIFSTLLALFVWRHFAIQALRLWARKTHQKYDDIFVEIVSWIGNLLIVTIIYTIFVNTYFVQEHLISILNKYALGFLVISALLGYAGKETIENFFSGLVLQVDRPFELGDRLVLPSGEICDIKSIGMRSVTLYDVLANTELSIPNNILSKMIITNISRPDSQLRIRIPIYVRLQNSFRVASKGTSEQEYNIIATCEAALIFIAYFEPEISLALTSPPEHENSINSKYDTLNLQTIWSSSYGRRREDIRSSLERLKSKSFFDSSEITFEKSNEALNAFIEKRKWSKLIINKINDGENEAQPSIKNFETNIKEWKLLFSENINSIWQQVHAFGRLEKSVLQLKGEGEIKNIRSVDLEPLLNELQREPAVHSEFLVAPSGEMYAKITLNCYANHLERRYEVTHLFNRYIEAFFKELQIEYSANNNTEFFDAE